MFDVEQQKTFLWKVLQVIPIQERYFSPQKKFNYIFGLRVLDSILEAKKRKKEVDTRYV